MRFPMLHTWCFALVLGFGAPTLSGAEAVISNGVLRARVHLPDAVRGFYRGTRFDWSGVVGDLEFQGHDFYPRWFDQVDPAVHDFVYRDGEIVAGPCTAVTGPTEEFSTGGKALGFDEAPAGGTFIKIGVGVLSRPDEAGYDPYRLYPIKDGGRWTIQRRPDGVEFQHELADAASGYGYRYRKVLSLTPGKPQMVLDHAFRNLGTRPIQSSVYNHNFMFLDRRPPGPECSVLLPFRPSVTTPATAGLAKVDGNRISFARTLAGEDRVYLDLRGFSAEPKDYDVRIEDRRARVGVRMTGDRPLSRLALWAIRAPLSVEPFVDFTVEPGKEFTWRITYDFLALPNEGK